MLDLKVEERQEKETGSEFKFCRDHADLRRQCHTVSDSLLTGTSAVLKCNGGNAKDRLGTLLRLMPEGGVVQIKHTWIQMYGQKVI